MKRCILCDGILIGTEQNVCMLCVQEFSNLKVSDDDDYSDDEIKIIEAEIKYQHRLNHLSHFLAGASQAIQMKLACKEKMQARRRL